MSTLPVQSPAALLEVQMPAVTEQPTAAGTRVTAPGWRARFPASRAVAEVSYRLRRTGPLGLAGLLLIASAAATFAYVYQPQRAAVDTLLQAVAHPVPGATASATAVTDVSRMLTALPVRSHAPEVVAQILKQAESAGVELARGRYEYILARDGLAARYRISLPVRTTYPQLRTFLDKTLIALPGVAVEGLRIERKNVGDDSIEAEIKLSVFVRDES
jgi:hypothetical protein